MSRHHHHGAFHVDHKVRDVFLMGFGALVLVVLTKGLILIPVAAVGGWLLYRRSTKKAR